MLLFDLFAYNNSFLLISPSGTIYTEGIFYADIECIFMGSEYFVISTFNDKHYYINKNEETDQLIKAYHEWEKKHDGY